jgi:hypothetical protein
MPGKLGSWDYTFEAASQFGSINVGGLRRSSSLAVNATGGYTGSMLLVRLASLWAMTSAQVTAVQPTERMKRLSSVEALNKPSPFAI